MISKGGDAKLTNEIICSESESIQYRTWPKASYPSLLGRLHITNFRIILIFTKEQDGCHEKKEEIDQKMQRFKCCRRRTKNMASLPTPLTQIPDRFHFFSIALGSILSVMIVGSNTSKVLEIQCKDETFLQLEFPAKSTQYISTVASLLIKLCTSETPGRSTVVDDPSQEQVSVTHKGTNKPGWQLYDLEHEYQRLGFLNSSTTGESFWKVYDNSNFELCATYPKMLVLPSAATQDQIRASAGYRSKGRLPVATWRHPETNAVIARSSQPKVGPQRRRCPADEQLLELYRTVNSSLDSQHKREHFLHIVDARKKLAAQANQVKGKGTEQGSEHNHIKVHFCSIENIHAIRKSLSNLRKVLNQHSINHPSVWNPRSDMHIQKSIEETDWLFHIRCILDASLLVSKIVHDNGESVLIHCSDGWDRTSQICATSQLLLDPYYRTFSGFIVLVEKDWLSFGHQFQKRCGNFNSKSKDRSPIFLQWLDCVHQLLVQFPTSFEISQAFLSFLAEQVYSQYFGTFLGNSERERKGAVSVQQTLQSVWDYAYDQEKSFSNPNYEEINITLWPNLRQVSLWEEYHHRFDPGIMPSNDFLINF